jgi:hypothetical protein
MLLFIFLWILMVRVMLLADMGILLTSIMCKISMPICFLLLI